MTYIQGSFLPNILIYSPKLMLHYELCVLSLLTRVSCTNIASRRLESLETPLVRYTTILMPVVKYITLRKNGRYFPSFKHTLLQLFCLQGIFERIQFNFNLSRNEREISIKQSTFCFLWGFNWIPRSLSEQIQFTRMLLEEMQRKLISVYILKLKVWLKCSN